MQTVAIENYEANPAAYYEAIGRDQETFVVTKNGSPIFQIAPPPQQKEPSGERKGRDIFDKFHIRGSYIIGDVVSPIYTDAEWEEFFEASAAQLTDTY